MVKSKRGKTLIIVAFVFAIFTLLVLPVLFFPLKLDLSGHVFHVGDTMSVTATVTNKSGLDVTVISNTGYGTVPWVNIHNVRNIVQPVTPALPYGLFLCAGDKTFINFEKEFTESGIYVVEAYYDISVNGYPMWNRLYSIVIVLK